MVFKRKSIHFNIFRPKPYSVNLNFLTRYFKLYIFGSIYEVPKVSRFNLTV